ncbi:MAG: hypothetical protein J5903_03525 [Clostridia bacterium]|nr:hypothetical protein [Clostridia bacterium]
MNIIFIVVFICSVAAATFISPETAVAAMTDGAVKAVTLSLSLTALYAVWSGVAEVAEKAGVTQKISRMLSPVTSFIYGETDEKTRGQLSLNFTANLLGLGGIATPAGINAAKLLCEDHNDKAADALFIVAATSIQLLPVTVVTLRGQYGSSSPSDIFLTTLLSTAVSTLTGLLLLKLTENFPHGKRNGKL